MNSWMQAGIAALAAALAYAWMRASKAKAPTEGKKESKLPLAVLFIALWVACGRVLTAIYGTYSKTLKVEIFAEQVRLFGVSISSSIVCVWGIMAVTAVLAILFRVFAVPRFNDKSKGLQNLVEISIEAIDNYTHGKLHVATDALACYMFTIALLMVGSAITELVGLRPPMADLKMTMSMALITFLIINYYGVKEKGIGGRVKSYMQPTPVIFPIKLLTDLAIPVSLGCRLFGNMLGGMIVMDLLKVALGANGIGLPPIVGLYFNVFHPLIQTYIFVTLSLTFINEAVE